MLFQLNWNIGQQSIKLFLKYSRSIVHLNKSSRTHIYRHEMSGRCRDTDIRIIQLVNIWSDFFIRSWWTSCRHIYLTWHYRKHSLSLFLRLMTPFDNGKYSTMFKVPRRSNCRYPIFTFSYTISLSERSCQISIYYEHWNSRSLDLYFREFTAAINFSCSSLNR